CTPLPVGGLAGDGLQVGEHQIAVLVVGDVLGHGQGPVGELAGPGGVPGDRVRAGQRLVGEGEVPVADAVPLAEVQDPAGVVQGGFGPAEHGVDTGDLPFTAGQVRRGGGGHLAPVVAGGGRGVDHAVVVVLAAPLELQQPPGLVEQLRGQQLDVGDAA